MGLPRILLGDGLLDHFALRPQPVKVQKQPWGLLSCRWPEGRGFEFCRDEGSIGVILGLYRGYIGII